jgi:hypothetical protein
LFQRFIRHVEEVFSTQQERQGWGWVEEVKMKWQLSPISIPPSVIDSHRADAGYRECVARSADGVMRWLYLGRGIRHKAKAGAQTLVPKFVGYVVGGHRPPLQ